MYCERRDLADRLSETGLVYVADDDASQTAGAAEWSAAVDQAIRAASSEIDAAILPHADPPSGVNEWLRQRAIDLAAEHLAERKGGQVPASLAGAALRARELLERVRLGTLRVPGLVYRHDRERDRTRGAGAPRVGNPATTVRAGEVRDR